MTATERESGDPPRWQCGDRAIDPRPLAAVRIALAGVMALGMLRMLVLGWPQRFYHEPPYHFTYRGFGWVAPLPPGWFEALILVAAGAAAALAIGWRCRTAAAVFALAFTWIELCDVSTYLNHYYLVSLLAMLFIWLPSGACWSLDARRRAAHGLPALVVRQRHRWLLCGQVAVVYGTAALAKVHADWLLHGMPLHLWLSRYGDLPLIGGVMEQRGTAIAASWAGFVYDLTIAGLLWWRRTNRLAMVAVVVFHLTTWLLFPIGLFPWVMIAASLAFWPLADQTGSAVTTHAPRRSSVALAAVVIWLAIQVVWPWRYLLHPGDVRWHEQGFRFGWRVMVMEKTGLVSFRVVAADGSVAHIDPVSVLAPHQVKQVSTQPDLILACAHHLAELADGPVAVYADAWVSINGRPPARLIDPQVDLISVTDGWDRTTYVLPPPDNMDGGWLLDGWLGWPER